MGTKIGYHITPKQLIHIVVLFMVFPSCTKEESEITIINNSACNVNSESTFFNDIEKSKHNYTYDANNLEMGYLYFDEGRLEIEHKNYKHDNFGNIIYKEVFKEGNLDQTISATFLNIDKPLSESISTINNKGVAITEYTYNVNNYLTRVLKYGYHELTSDTFVSYEEKNFRHDSYGNVTYKEFYNGIGELKHNQINTYIGLDKPLIETMNWQNGTVRTTEYTYNEKEWLIGTKVTQDGQLYWETKNYQQNDNGHPTFYEFHGQYIAQIILTYHCYNM